MKRKELEKRLSELEDKLHNLFRQCPEWCFSSSSKSPDEKMKDLKDYLGETGLGSQLQETYKEWEETYDELCRLEHEEHPFYETDWL